MNFRAFRGLSEQEQVDYLYAVLDANGGANIEEVRQQLFNAGHLKEQHFGLTSEQMVGRTISELRSVSVFETGDEAINFIECVLFDDDKLRDVAAWLSDYNPRDLRIGMNMREYVGKGVDDSFNEKTTDALTIILSKTHDYDNELGFYVKTAYPDIKHEKAEYTGRDFRNLAKELLKKEENELCRGYWGLKLGGFDNAYISNKHADKKIVVPFQHGNERYALCFSKISNPTVVRSDLDYGNAVNIRDLNSTSIPSNVLEKINTAIKAYDDSVLTKNVDAKLQLTETNKFYDQYER